MYSGLARNWMALAARGVLAILFGIFALTRPGIALPVLVMGFGVAVLPSGILHIFAAIRLRRDMRDEMVLVANGVLTAAFGVLMVLLPWAGILALVWLVGASSLCFGVLLVIVALRLRTQWQAQNARAQRA